MLYKPTFLFWVERNQLYSIHTRWSYVPEEGNNDQTEESGEDGDVEEASLPLVDRSTNIYKSSLLSGLWTKWNVLSDICPELNALLYFIVLKTASVSGQVLSVLRWSDFISAIVFEFFILDALSFASVYVILNSCFSHLVS